MMTYTNCIDLYKSLTNDVSSANVTFGNTLMNQSIKNICSIRPWKFLEASKTIATVAATAAYFLPYNFKKLVNITFTVSTTIYSPKEIKSQRGWNVLNAAPSSTNTPSHYYIYGNKLYLYGTPITAGNTITVYYKKRIKDISVADYTTGTVAATNASKTITGTGTTFTAAMVGRWIKITGDEEWYEIAAFVSTTELTLTNTYSGTTNATAAYIIGDVSIIPEDYQVLPVFKAASLYWASIGNNMEKSAIFANEYNIMLKDLLSTHCASSEDIEVGDDESDPIDANLYLTIT